LKTVFFSLGPKEKYIFNQSSPKHIAKSTNSKSQGFFSGAAFFCVASLFLWHATSHGTVFVVRAQPW
jgi:hypothetical protein